MSSSGPTDCPKCGGLDVAEASSDECSSSLWCGHCGYEQHSTFVDFSDKVTVDGFENFLSWLRDEPKEGKKVTGHIVVEKNAGVFS